MRYPLIVLGLATAAAGLVAYHSATQATSGSDSSEASDTSDASGGSVPAPLAGAITHAYRFDRAIQATSNSGSLVDLKLTGKFYVRSAAGKPKTALVQITEAATPDGKMTDLPWVKLDLTGAYAVAEVQDVSKNDETTDAAARFARDVMDQYSFHSKSDLQGAYEATFHSLNASHTKKQKSKYLSEPYSSARIDSSSHELTLASDGWPQLIQGNESIQLGEDQISIRTESRYRIEADANPSDETFDRLAVQNFQKVRVATADSNDDTHSSWMTDPQALAETPSLDVLLLKLRSGALKESGERMAWYRQAVRRLTAETGKLESVRQALPELRAQPEQLSLLIGALATTPQSDAQLALLETYRDTRYSTEDKSLIMSAWTATDATLPSETTSFLSNMALDPSTAPEQAQSAMLALGAQARKSAQSQPGEDAIEPLLISKLKQAKTEGETVAALDAMGNAGSTGLLPYIQDYLSNGSANLRAHAYMALRFIPGQNIAALIQGGAADPSKEVQSSAALSLELRDSAS